MATEDNSPESPALEGFPLSIRIAEGVAQMSRAITCLEHIGIARCGIADESIAREQPEIHFVDPDPDQMARIKAGRNREVERSPVLEDQLELKTPQFFLRHTHRVERFADDRWLEYTRKKIFDVNYGDDLRSAHHCTFEKWDSNLVFCSTRVAQYLADKHVLMVQTPWREVFGRPDPVADDQ